jgi:hypothetical protein
MFGPFPARGRLTPDAGGTDRTKANRVITID